jgi:transcription-repair coupling factor (superfamily II helicase)
VQSIQEVAGIIQRLVPEARVAVGHGQMDGDKLEDVMLSFYRRRI